MEFRVLGPLEVFEAGQALEIGGLKPRALLAVLLLNANRVVSFDRLVDALWEEAPPETAVKALQVYASQLRKSIGGDRIATRAGGYMLHVAPGELDLERFEALVARGDGEALQEALSLWRGPPLADFAYDQFARTEIARLEELRVAAQEERFAADLELGRHLELVGELNALIALHPFRERLRWLLMLALYRSGRQAEALDAYQDARRVLVDELGIEPTPELRELEGAILRQDPALGLATPVGSPVGEPPPVAAHPSVGATPLAPERKLATVLVADLGSSTELGDRDPERTRALLARSHEAMTEEIERAGGTVQTFSGDEVMAAFGVPVAQEEHAERALHAALAMRARFRELFGGSLAPRIGVNTGEVVAEPARDGGTLVTGDVVSVAARLMQAAASGEISVGERTVAVARDAFEFGEEASGDAGGKTQVIPCRELLAALSLPRPHGLGLGFRRTFVGRETELELMQAAYERAVRNGEPHLLTVMGDAGVGKTSLVQEFRDWLRAQPQQPLLRSGRCLAYGRGITYWPLGEVLKEHLGVLESDPPEVVRERLGDRRILGLTLGLDVAGDLHPLVARERLYDAWVELVDELVSVRPAVVLVEDLHWADEPLLDLLDHLLRDVSGPLFLLATARPELLDRRSTWDAGRRDSTRLWLEPLSLEEAARMLEELLGPELPARLRQLVLEQAEGNPFFLEELVAALIDRGFLVRQDAGWQLPHLPASFRVPDSVESILAARIDLLGPAEKAALQAASVVGRVFWASPVLELSGGIEANTGVLVERDFVRRRPTSSMASEQEFAFKHALTRDVAYASLPKARRARLHAAFARWIERVGAGRDEYAPLLAHHYAEAVRPEDRDLAWSGEDAEVELLQAKALVWLQRAAELAAGRYALDEQIGLLERAVEYEPSPTSRALLRREIIHAHALNYDDDSFRNAMLSAIADSTNESELAELSAEAALHSAVRWQLESDRELIDEWSRTALELAGSSRRVRAQALVARSICHPEEAAAAAREAESIAARIDDAELQSWALYMRADAALADGAYEDAQGIVEKRLDTLARIDDPDHRADAYWAALPAYCGTGRFDEARRIAGLYDEETIGLTPHHRLHGIAVLLEVEQLTGNWRRIRELTPRAEQAAEQCTTRCLQGRLTYLTCALACAYLGDDDEAQRLEHRSEQTGIDLYGRMESPIWLALHRADLTTASDLVDELERPRQSFLRSRKLAPVAARLDALAALGRREALEGDAPALLRPGTYLEPFALRALGVVRPDAALVEQAARRFDAMGLAWHAAHTRDILHGSSV